MLGLGRPARADSCPTGLELKLLMDTFNITPQLMQVRAILFPPPVIGTLCPVYGERRIASQWIRLVLLRLAAVAKQHLRRFSSSPGPAPGTRYGTGPGAGTGTV